MRTSSITTAETITLRSELYRKYPYYWKLIKSAAMAKDRETAIIREEKARKYLAIQISKICRK